MPEETSDDPLRFVTRNVGDTLGIPTRLRQFASEHPGLCIPLQTPPRSVASRSVVQWDRWSREFGTSHNEKGQLQYWSGKAPYFGASMVDRDDLKQFTTEIVSEKWSCDISDIVGLSASRSNLEKFLTLDEFAETDFPEMLHPISEDKIRELLGKNSFYSEFAGITDVEKQSGRFSRYMWDEGRIYLANSVDMHPLIAARYIAKRLQKPIRVYGTLHTYRINFKAAQTLTGDFDIYTMPGPGPYVAFLEAMRMFGAPFGVYGLPRGVFFNKGHGMTAYLGSSLGFRTLEESEAQGVQLIFLPREDKLAMRVSAVLREASMFDAGRFIKEAAQRQATT